VLPPGFFADFFWSNIYKDSRKFYFVKNLYITIGVCILETQLLGLLYGGDASFVQKLSMPWMSANIQVPFLYSLISMLPIQLQEFLSLTMLSSNNFRPPLTATSPQWFIWLSHWTVNNLSEKVNYPKQWLTTNTSASVSHLLASLSHLAISKWAISLSHWVTSPYQNEPSPYLTAWANLPYPNEPSPTSLSHLDISKWAISLSKCVISLYHWAISPF
jgi:hypothetical protein